MANFKCHGCGSELFFQSIPQTFDEGDLRVFNAGQLIKADHNSVTLLTCVDCGKTTIPSVSLQGKNALDKDVQVYRKLIDVVSNHNSRIAALSAITKIQEQYKNLEFEFTQLKTDLNTLRDLCADIDPQVINPRLDGVVGEISVKKGGRSKKNS